MTRPTPLPAWTRCPRHLGMQPAGRACTACVEEARTGAKLKPLRGERLEDVNGNEIRKEIER